MNILMLGQSIGKAKAKQGFDRALTGLCRSFAGLRAGPLPRLYRCPPYRAKAGWVRDTGMIDIAKIKALESRSALFHWSPMDFGVPEDNDY